MKKELKGGEKKLDKNEQRQALKEDKFLRQLVTKGHRLLDPVVSKLPAFQKKIQKHEDLDMDTCASFDELRNLLCSWHDQCTRALGKISGGQSLKADELGFDCDKYLGEKIKEMKEVQKSLNFAITLEKQKKQQGN